MIADDTGLPRLAILGSGDLGQLLAHHAATSCGRQVVGFFDDFRARGERVGCAPILGGTEDVVPAFRAEGFDELLLAVGYKHFAARQALFERFAGAVPFARLIHPSAYVDPSATVGEGAVLLPGCVLDRNAVIEPNALLNTGCVVAHDTTVGAHSFLGPGVRLAGFITIERAVFLGIGTIVIDRVRVVSGVQTGGGTVVTKDLTAPGLWVGAPARLVRPA